MYDIQSLIYVLTMLVGDNAPHSVWVETRYTQLNSTEEVVESIKNNFPGIKAYAAIGNHGKVYLSIVHCVARNNSEKDAYK